MKSYFQKTIHFTELGKAYFASSCSKRKTLSSFVFLLLASLRSRKNLCHRHNTTLYAAALSSRARTLSIFPLLSFQKAHFCALIHQFLPFSTDLLYIVYSITADDSASTVQQTVTAVSQPSLDITRKLHSAAKKHTLSEP